MNIKIKRFLKQNAVFFIVYNLMFYTGDAEAASMVLGVAGAVVGSFFGMPQLGYALGSMIGNAFFTPAQKVEGPRLNDLRMGQTNTIGMSIPEIWGTDIVYGNIIWAGGFKEYKNTEEQGKGGPGVETTTYTYSVSFAVGLCAGPISGVRRIWANENLVYDASTENTGSTGDFKKYLRIYKGTQTEPDSLIQQYHGDYSPAFMDIAYLILEDLPLQDYGNQIPQLKVEVVNSPYASENTTLESKVLDNSINQCQLFTNPINNNIYRISGRNFFTQSTLIEIIDPLNLTVVKSVEIPFSSVSSVNGFENASKISVAKTGEIVFHCVDGSTNKSQYVIINPNTLIHTVIKSSDYTGSNDPFLSLKTSNINSLTDFMLINGSSGNNFISAVRKTDSELYYINMGLLTYLSSSSFKHVLNNSLNPYRVMCRDNDDYIYIPTYGKNVNSSINHKEIYLTRVNGYILEENFIKIHDDIFYNGYVTSMIYDDVSNKIFIFLRVDVGSNNVYKLIKFDVATQLIEHVEVIDIPQNKLIGGLLVSDIKISPMLSIDQYNRRLITSAFTNDNLGIGYLIYINIEDSQKYYISYSQSNFDGMSVANTPNNSIYSKHKDAYIFSSKKYSDGRGLIVNNGNKLSYGTYPMNLLVQKVALSTGMSLDLIDTSNISDIEVRGFKRANRMTARSLLETLSLLYNFDGVESGRKIIFSKRGKEPVATITEDELGARFFSKEAFSNIYKTQRTPEIELPKKANIIYHDVDKTYAQNTQDEKRFISTTENILSIEAPAVFTANEAKEIIKRIMYQTWVSRDKYQIEVNYDYAHLEPGDCINLIYGNNTYLLRIVKKDDGQGIIKLELVAEDSTIYKQNGVGATGAVLTQTVSISSDTDLYLLDIPIFDISDNNIGAYAVVDKKDSKGTWNGAVLYKSDSLNGKYTQQTTFKNYSIVGKTEGVLSNGGDTNYINYVDSIIVTINNGELESISEEDLDKGGNIALVGKEIIQFLNAELIAEKKYKLSGLLRGRFGTESEQSNHSINDLFIKLNFKDGSIKRINKDDYMIGVEKFYKAITVGKSIDDISGISFINNGVGLKPYSVINVNSGRNQNNDLLLSWDKRIRGQVIMGNILDPVDPDGDSYEIDILNNSNEVVRTIKTNSLSATYTYSEQIADFGSIQSQIKVKIYKLSSIIERGFEYSNTF